MRYFIVFLAVLGCVYADTPANCTYEDVQGMWIFDMGSRGHGSSLKCDSPASFEKVSSLRVNLLFPNLAIDEFGNKGFWTLIYNQGFEVVIHGRKFFAFSDFQKEGKNVTSICDRTKPGLSHNVLERDWACFEGHKAGAQVVKKVHQVKELSEEFLSQTYFKTDNNMINKINSDKSITWKAAHYPQYEKMTMADMLRRSGGRKSKIMHIPKPATPTRDQVNTARDMPIQFDWRETGFVSPVRDQGACGSCYAFSAMGMNEARWRLMTNNTEKPVFSPQDIVECSVYSQGCEGGFPYLIGGKYAEDFGLVEEKYNPYTGKDGECKTEPDSPRQYSYKYEYVGGFYGACNEELMIMNLVEHGPMSVSFEVYDDFVHYKGGIYHHTGLQNQFNPFEITNHAVLLVGYGEEDGQKYWTVKNSWGTTWGEEGYFRIRRGTDECSIESIAVQSFPLS